MELFPAKSETRTARVSLLESVWLPRVQLSLPTDVVAVVHVLPLSSETCTISPLTRLALVWPVMVWAAVFVMKSILEMPVSFEKAIDVAEVVGAVVSSS